MFVLFDKAKRLLGRNGSSGIAAMEFGLSAPLLVLMLVAAIEIGTSMYQGMQVQNAAEAGAVYASRYGLNATGISNAVANASPGTGVLASPAPSQFCGCPTVGSVTAVDCSGTCSDGSAPGQYARINARISHTPLISLAGLAAPTTISGEAVVRIY